VAGAALPIAGQIEAICDSLSKAPNLVLIAPPGAGKTTAVAPALLTQHWCTGRILLLSPRRLAARAAAEHMAELAGEPVGQTIGYATRMDSRQSPATRLLVVTEGIFRNMIQSDPELTSVSAVLFDEVHERSLECDFGLALALDAQAALRPDLRLVAMSATLDGSRFTALMHNAPVIVSEGRAYPISLHHLGRKAEARIEDEMAAAIRRAVQDEEGDILAFLPGVADIERTAARLAALPVAIHPLHGQLDSADQRTALRKGTQRKVILATSIAETSLTIEGVRIVIDSGLARRPRYDRAAGVTRLVTERVSQAAAIQRAGRAGRQQPGVVYRLWNEAATAGFAPFDPPEILEADLSPLLLDCALWGEADPARLRWLDPPPKAALDEARKRLRTLGALDEDGRPTPHGKAIAELPMALPLAHMLTLTGGAGAQMAVLLSERGLGGNDTDLDLRLDRWRREKGRRADAARALAKRWAQQTAQQTAGQAAYTSLSPAQQVALAYPDRVARRRDQTGEHWASVGGRGYRLDPTHPLAWQDWLAIADVQGSAAGARIMSAMAISWNEIDVLFAHQINTGSTVHFDPETGRVIAETGRRLGAITLTKGAETAPDPEAMAAALLGGVRTYGLAMLSWSDAARHLRSRAAFAEDARLSDAALIDALDLWLAPLLPGKRRLSDIDKGDLHQALVNLLGWEGQQALNRIAPAHFTAPAGQTHAIDYDAEAGPTVSLRVQALYGLKEHPCIGAHRTPLILSLLSPAGRPIQTTQDLPRFWAGSWADVAKDMRGQYPKHHWPDDPTAATASLMTKKRQGI
jgi:ATP-dependent helicase HrpB